LLGVADLGGNSLLSLDKSACDRQALRAEGMTSALMLKNSTGRRNLLKTLQNAFDKDSRAVIPNFSKLQVALYFGSLHNAKIALETDTKVLTGKRGARHG
jgi:hypothetical protein